MPELPEVETVARQLQTVLPGKVIQSVEVLKEKSFLGESLHVVGKKIVSVSRKQKMIVIELSGDEVVLIHLKMTGQLIFQPEVEKVRSTKYVVRGQKNNYEQRTTNNELISRIVGGHPTADWVGELPSKHTRVIFHFADGPASRRRTKASRGRSTLYFNDQRLFGWVRVMVRSTWFEVRSKIAPDVVDDTFTVDYLKKALQSSRRAVKLVILDQDKIGGMGNIYANDALYIASIHPNIPSNQLKMHAVIKLYQAMKQVIEAGIAAGGASYSHFVDTQGLGGHYQDQFLVYDREGQPCSTCQAKIQKFSLGGRGTYFCPHCQSINSQLI